jgi:hypothetical protein
MLRARHDTSTSNLVNHVDSCEGMRPAHQGTVAPFAHGSTYSKEKLRVLCALWTSAHYRPFNIVNDSHFRDIIKLFNPAAAESLPSVNTISRDVKEFYKLGKVNVKEFLLVRLFIWYGIYWICI